VGTLTVFCGPLIEKYLFDSFDIMIYVKKKIYICSVRLRVLREMLGLRGSE